MQAWQAYEEVTQVFTCLAAHPFQCLDTDSEHFKKIKRYVVILYDKTSSLSFVNEVDNIPPTQDALLQHTRRAVYQAGVWTSTQAHQILPPPNQFAW